MAVTSAARPLRPPSQASPRGPDLSRTTALSCVPLLPLPRPHVLYARAPNSRFWLLFILASCLLSGQPHPWIPRALAGKQVPRAAPSPTPPRPRSLPPARRSTTLHFQPPGEPEPPCLLRWGRFLRHYVCWWRVSLCRPGGRPGVTSSPLSPILLPARVCSVS